MKLEWLEFSADAGDADSIYVLGRGPALAIASEAALKFKETTGFMPKPFPRLHGPVALVGTRFPGLALAARDAAEGSVAEIADALSAKGAIVHITSARATRAKPLPFVETGHPITDALALVLPFYVFVEAWSRSRGYNPDAPANFKKVTNPVIM